MAYDGYGAQTIDFSPLAQLPQIYKKAQQDQSLADLGKALSSGNVDYRQAAGLAVGAGRPDLAVGFLNKANELSAHQDFVGGLGGGQPQATLGSLGEPQGQPAPQVASQPSPAPGGNVPPQDQGFTPRTSYSQNDKIVSAVPEGPGPNEGVNVADNFNQRFASAGPGMGAPPPAPQPPPTPQPQQVAASAPRPVQRQLAPAAQGLSRQAIHMIDTMGNPNASPGDRQAAQMMLQRELPEDDKIMTTAEGDVIAVNARTHQVTPLLHSQTKPFDIGPDAFGGQRKGVFGKNGEIVPLDIPAAKNSVGTGDQLSGDEFLKTQDPQMAALIKKVANYEINPVTFSTKGGHREQILSRVAQYDPTYDGAMFPARAAAVKSFALAKGDTIRSFDVAVTHLDQLSELATALKNGDMKAYNAAANAIKEQFGGTAPGNFDALKGIVGNEIIKAVIGGKGALGDREKTDKVLSNIKTPDQLAGIIQTYKSAMGAQLNGLKKQYEDTTGLKNFDTRLSPNTLKELAPHAPAAPAQGIPAPPPGFVIIGK